MGTLTYAGTVVGFEDRVLTHLQVVIVQKFRRGEPFPFSWMEDAAAHGGRGALWLTPSVPILFHFDRSQVPAIDHRWVDLLAASANSSRGLVAMDALGRPIAAVPIQLR